MEEEPKKLDAGSSVGLESCVWLFEYLCFSFVETLLKGVFHMNAVMNIIVFANAKTGAMP